MKITFMGSGTSLGVPTIGCPCRVCVSDNPKNKRTRPSLLVKIGEMNLLIDTATDFRQQAIRENLKRVDAVLYTHAHADHILGLNAEVLNLGYVLIQVYLREEYGRS